MLQLFSLLLQAQMIRRVKAYLAKMPVIRDEDVLHRMSLEAEPAPLPPPTAHIPLPASSASSAASHQMAGSKGLSGRNSTASLNSIGVRMLQSEVRDENIFHLCSYVRRLQRAFLSFLFISVQMKYIPIGYLIKSACCECVTIEFRFHFRANPGVRAAPLRP